MKNIDIIGRGNVAFHLAKAFSGKANVRQINPHTLSDINLEADLIIISVVDSAIREIAEKLKNLGCQTSMIVHTSGSTGLDIFEGLEFNNCGVLYPLQTFSKDKPLDYSKIPFFIESSTEEGENSLIKYAGLISDRVIKANSEKRKRLHIAAVLGCNFVNHLWALADLYLNDARLDFKDLLPLIEETMQKVKNIPPKLAQTGPGVRGDNKIIEDHIASLKEYPKIRELYKLLSESIQDLKK